MKSFANIDKNIATKSNRHSDNSLQSKVNIARIVQMAKVKPSMLTANNVAQLQKAIGNRAVVQLLKGNVMQNNTEEVSEINAGFREKPVQFRFDVLQKIDSEDEDMDDEDMEDEGKDDEDEDDEDSDEEDMDDEDEEDEDDSGDSDYEEEGNGGAPDGYMKPSEYHDMYEKREKAKHSHLEECVRVKKVNNCPALWWIANVKREEKDFELTGTRERDKALLGKDHSGYTWHHCADHVKQGGIYGMCTMQLVPTTEHESWGHIGGASLAGY